MDDTSREVHPPDDGGVPCGTVVLPTTQLVRSQDVIPPHRRPIVFSFPFSNITRIFKRDSLFVGPMPFHSQDTICVKQW